MSGICVELDQFVIYAKEISRQTKQPLMYEDIHGSGDLGLPLILKVRPKNPSGDLVQSSGFFNLIHHKKDSYSVAFSHYSNLRDSAHLLVQHRGD